MSVWQSDLNKLLKQYLPPVLRTPVHVKWVEVFAHGFVQVFDALKEYRTQTLKELAYNGQTNNLKRMLNDKFDKILRRIEVYNIFALYLPDVFWQVAEAAPNYFYQVAEATPNFIYTELEYYAPVTVEVHIPSDYLGMEATIRRIIESVLISTVRYVIVWI
jgi:hypothetical protein